MPLINRLSYLLICTVVMFTTLAYGTVHQPTIALFYMTVFALVLLWGVEAVSGGALRISKCWLQFPIYALAFYAFIQTVPFGSAVEPGRIAGIPGTISVEPFATRMAGLHIVIIGVYFSLLLIYIDGAERVKKTAIVLTVFGSVYAFYSILQSILSPDKILGIYKPLSAMPFGTFVNRHNFAAFMEMLVSIPLGLLFVGAVGRDKRLIVAVAVALMIVALILSGSRGGLVAFLCQVVFLILLTSGVSGKRNLFLKIGLSILMTITGVLGVLFVGGESSLTRIASTPSGADISSNRFEIWNATLRIIAEYLPFGSGIGAYPQAYSKFDQMSGYSRVEQAHNDYLQIVSDAGLIGLLLGGFFLYRLISRGRLAIRSENLFLRGIAVGAFAGCIGILVHSVFDFVLHTTAISVMFLTLISLVVAAGRLKEDEKESFGGDPPLNPKRASVTALTSQLKRL